MVSPHPPLSASSSSLSTAVAGRHLPLLLLLLVLLLLELKLRGVVEGMKRRYGSPWADVVGARVARGWTVASGTHSALEARLALRALLSAYLEVRRQTLRRLEGVMMLMVAVLREAGAFG